MNEQIWHEIFVGLGETLYTSVFATLLAYAIGLPVGVILAVTDKDGIKPNAAINKIIGFTVNVLRSIPFLILFVLIMPFTRLIAGTTIGAAATVVPLTVAAAPFIARLCETSFKEVSRGAIEASVSCGATTTQLICKTVIPESAPLLLRNAAIGFVTVLGYSAMAGFCGGGGLGSIAINYGYYRNNQTVMLVTVAIIVIIVQVFQEAGLYLAKKQDKRKK